MSDLDRFVSEQLEDPEFREYYIDMKVSSDIAKAIINGRMLRNLSQKELAKLTGVSQANISRYENCENLPSVTTLKRIAKALDLMIKIEFVPVSFDHPEAPTE